MLESALAALQSLADPGLLLMLLIGVAAGLIIGLIPGLGGTGAVAILLPVTFGMDPEQALALLIGALGGCAHLGHGGCGVAWRTRLRLGQRHDARRLRHGQARTGR